MSIGLPSNVTALSRRDPTDYAHLNRAASDAERSLIGCCLMYPNALQVAIGLVDADTFGEQAHRGIWEAMVDLAASGRHVTPITVLARLGDIQLGPGLTAKRYLAELAAETACPPQYVADFARQVREYAALQTIVARLEDARGAALAPGSDPRAIIGDLMQCLDETRAAVEPMRSGLMAVGEVSARVIERMDDIRSGQGAGNAVTTGLRDLDARLGGGWKRGDLVVVAGRPGMGKTTFAASSARQSAKHGHAGVFFSLEMPEQQIGARVVADEAYTSTRPITAQSIYQGSIIEFEAAAVAEAARRTQAYPLAIDASSALTVGEISARTRSAQDRFARAGRQLEFVAVDYLKFVKASDRYRSQRHYEVGEITAGLKALAKDMGIAVILLAQLNRQTEQRPNKRPELADLRESGDIEADADIVIFLYREAYYLASDPKFKDDPAALADRMSQCDNVLEVIIAKHRMGATGKVDLFCHVGASAVRDLMRGY